MSHFDKVAVSMPGITTHHPAATYALRFVLLAALYAGVVWLSLALIPPGTSGALLVWPASAVGLAALLFWGFSLWPALMLGIFLVLVGRGIEPLVAAGASVGNVVESLVGAYILMRVGFHPLMSRLRDMLGLALAAFIATFVSGIILTGNVALNHGAAFSWVLLGAVWLGHTVSLLSFGPFVIRWGYRPFFTKTWREVAEGLLLFGTLATSTFLVTWTPHGSVGGISLFYVLMLCLVWASLRAGPRGMSLSLLLMATITISGVLWGYAPGNTHSAQALFGVQLFLGTFSLLFLLFTSITEERKEALIATEGHVGQLENALERISQEDKAKSEFIAILAHELRNPLSPVLSGLELLKTRGTQPDDVLRMMGAHLHALARLLDDLLDITRISQKKFKIERETITLQEILGRSFEMASPYITSRGHTFTKQVPEERLWVDADPVRLAQVFVNLLNNAAKYTPQGGTINLSVVREGEEALVRVRDSGQGIEPQQQQKIFEPFAGGAQPTENTSGLHIGLSLAKRMAELHQGSIEVKSGGKGEGSEFTVRLPLLPVVQEPLIPLPKKEQRGRFSKEAMAAHAKAAGAIRVLVVDDNEAAAKMLGTLLEHNGHQVSLAYSGLDALKEARSVRPQVALLDIGLPDIDGYEVGRRLRAEFNNDISLIALTGYGQDEDRDKATAAGFDEHLVKPVSIVDVERALANLKKA